MDTGTPPIALRYIGASDEHHKKHDEHEAKLQLDELVVFFLYLERSERRRGRCVLVLEN